MIPNIIRNFFFTLRNIEFLCYFPEFIYKKKNQRQIYNKGCCNSYFIKKENEHHESNTQNHECVHFLQCPVLISIIFQEIIVVLCYIIYWLKLIRRMNTHRNGEWSNYSYTRSFYEKKQTLRSSNNWHESLCRSTKRIIEKGPFININIFFYNIYYISNMN